MLPNRAGVLSKLTARTVDIPGTVPKFYYIGGSDADKVANLRGLAKAVQVAPGRRCFPMPSGGEAGGEAALRRAAAGGADSSAAVSPPPAPAEEDAEAAEVVIKAADV